LYFFRSTPISLDKAAACTLFYLSKIMNNEEEGLEDDVPLLTDVSALIIDENENPTNENNVEIPEVVFEEIVVRARRQILTTTRTRRPFSPLGLAFDTSHLLGTFPVRGSSVENNRDRAASKIQAKFCTYRFSQAEASYKQSIQLCTTWVGRLLQIPSYAARLISHAYILGNLPKGLPFNLYTYKNKQIISFDEDLSLERRQLYAARCALSSQPLLSRSGRASFVAFFSSSSLVPDEKEHSDDQHNRKGISKDREEKQQRHAK